MRLLGKTVLLLSVVALVPVAFAVFFLLDVNREAVATSERQLQVAVLAEVAGAVMRGVRDAQADADAVAVALAEAAASKRPEDEAMTSVRAILATRRAIDAARFEVPSAGVSTVLRRAEDGAREVPVSTPRLRELADERGVGFSVVAPGRGALVVPIAFATSAGAAKGARGYVTVLVDLAPLATVLSSLAETRFAGGAARLVVVDDRRAVVARHGVPALALGDSASPLPIWEALPAGTPWTQRVGVVSHHHEAGETFAGAIESVPELGWAVAIWRPESVAYAALHRMRVRGAMVAGFAVLLSLVAGGLAARRITNPVVALSRAATVIGARRWREVAVPSFGRDEIGELGDNLRQMAGDLESSEQRIAEEARLRADLGRYLSKELVSSIVAGKQSLALGGERRTVTVLFADVVAFTPLAETKPAEEVVALLNELFSLLTEIVFRHQGTVDKFVGDCLMAVWGAPVAHEDHAARALSAAEDMMRFLENANDTFREKYGVEIRLGIGVNTGEVIVGNVGSDKRMEYTVIGDAVNVAARLEAIAAPNQVLIGEATHDAAGEAFETQLLGERKLTGRAAETRVYALVTG